jgi:small subunit ribosomal protein S8
MTVTDPIADMLTRIRNALKERKAIVEIPFSKIKFDVCGILKDEGFIKDVKSSDKDLVRKTIIVTLKYVKKNKPIIDSIKRISKSSKRIYVKKQDVPKVLNGFGISILSTSKGILSGREARLKNVGGELLAEVF